MTSPQVPPVKVVEVHAEEFLHKSHATHLPSEKMIQRRKAIIYPYQIHPKPKCTALGITASIRGSSGPPGLWSTGTPAVIVGAAAWDQTAPTLVIDERRHWTSSSNFSNVFLVLLLFKCFSNVLHFFKCVSSSPGREAGVFGGFCLLLVSWLRRLLAL